jgi:hypothetical protein
LLLEIFADARMIAIKSREENSYIIEFISNPDFSKIIELVKYEEFIELMNTINDYKNGFMNIEL